MSRSELSRMSQDNIHLDIDHCPVHHLVTWLVVAARSQHMHTGGLSHTVDHNVHAVGAIPYTQIYTLFTPACHALTLTGGACGTHKYAIYTGRFLPHQLSWWIIWCSALTQWLQWMCSMCRVQLMEESRLDEQAGIKNTQSASNSSKVDSPFILKLIAYCVYC